MARSQLRFNRSTAEVLANHIADSVGKDVSLLDIMVLRTARGHVIQMEYELDGGPHHRVLRTVNDVESFLQSPHDFTVNSTPDNVSWDHELDE